VGMSKEQWPRIGHGQRTTTKDGCNDELSTRERLAPMAVMGMDDGTDDDG
jgi:hypothetical protein